MNKDGGPLCPIPSSPVAGLKPAAARAAVKVGVGIGESQISAASSRSIVYRCSIFRYFFVPQSVDDT